MVLSLPLIRASNTAITHKTKPVAVFVGGTSGIGEGMVRTFAQHTHGNADIVIVGRNQSAAENIFASIPSPDAASSPSPAARDFIQCDATLMRNVESATQTIRSKYPKINYLVITTGIMTLAGRDETFEGIDKKLAVHYYARWKFLHDLLPAVSRAKAEDDTGSAMSVMSAGHGSEIDLDDLGLKKTFTLNNAAMAAPTYNDLMLERFSEEYPTLPLIHSFPGGVRTNLLRNSSSPLLRVSNFLMYLVRPFTTSIEECGEYMWHAINSTAKEPRAWRVNSVGEDIGKKSYYGNEEQRTKLWNHTSEEISNALTKEAPTS